MAPDEEWKPSGRPQSIMARNFSASLHDVFDIDNNLGGLEESVEQKKKALDSQTRELEALEAKLRETEERLKERQSRNSSPAGRGPHSLSPSNSTSTPLPTRRQQQQQALTDDEMAVNGTGASASALYHHHQHHPPHSSPLNPQPARSPVGARAGAGESSAAYDSPRTGYRKPVGQGVAPARQVSSS